MPQTDSFSLKRNMFGEQREWICSYKRDRKVAERNPHGVLGKVVDQEVGKASTRECECGDKLAGSRGTVTAPMGAMAFSRALSQSCLCWFMLLWFCAALKWVRFQK